MAKSTRTAVKPRRPTPRQQYVGTGVNGVFVIVDRKGKITYVDGQTKITKTADLPDRCTPPLTIVSSNYSIFPTGDRPNGYESVVIVDALGTMWVGSVRSEIPFEKLK